jgi:hypothetical protein
MTSTFSKPLSRRSTLPKAVIEAIEGLTVEQHVSWKKVVEKIEKEADDPAKVKVKRFALLLHYPNIRVRRNK